MKKLLVIFLLWCGLSLMPAQAKSQYVSVTFQTFYDDLSPHGIWINNPSYGYVWVPNVGAGFRPYETSGYWVYSDAGWTWVSNYSWGWAPFHYGRWYYDPFYGYVWIPGTEWGPAWVSWRYTNGYYGWAPLGPGVTYGASYINYNPPAERWVFVRENDFGSRNTTYVDRSTNVTLIKNSTVINNTVVNKQRNETYIAGPVRKDVERVSGKPLAPVAIRDNADRSVKLNNNQLMVHRPQVQNKSSDRKPAPAKVYTDKEAKPIIEKRGTTVPGQKPVTNTRPIGDRPVTPSAKPAQQLNKDNRLQPNTAPVRKTPGNEPGRVIPKTENRETPPRANPQQMPDRRDGQDRILPQQTRPQPVQPRNEMREQKPVRDVPQQQIRRDEPRQVAPQRTEPPVQPRHEMREQPQERIIPNQPQMRDEPRQVAPQRTEPPVQPRQEMRQEPQQRIMPNQPQMREEPRQMPQQRMEPPAQPQQRNAPHNPPGEQHHRGPK